MTARMMMRLAVLLGALLALGASPTKYGDHIGAYNFMIEVSGVEAGYFKGVDGLSAELEVIEFQDGDDLFLRKPPSKAKTVTLRAAKIPKTIRAWKKKADAREVKIHLELIRPTATLKKGRSCTFVLKGARVRNIGKGTVELALDRIRRLRCKRLTLAPKKRK